MATILVDPGGRIYAAAGTSGANVLSLWDSAGNIANWSVNASTGRTIGSSLRTTSGSASYLQKGYAATQTVGAAFGVRFNTALPAAAITPIAFYDGASIQVDVRLNADGSLSLTRNGTVLATTAGGTIASGTYYHVEAKFKIASGTSGAYDLWVNGTNLLTSAAANTQATANATASASRLGNNSAQAAAGTIDFDDIILYNGATTDANGFADISGPVGDCGLAWVTTSGAGTTTQFTPSTAVANYTTVDEATPNGDTDYVEDATVGHVDTYAMADLPAAVATVKALVAVHYARKTDVGSRGMKAEVRSGGTDYTHATEIALADTYKYYLSVWGQDPATSAAWTPSGVNALEAGEKVSS